MEVILREDCLPLGYVGDTVRVRRGYARNFLIPRGLAVESSAHNDRLLKHKLGAIVAKRIKRKAEAEAFGNILQQVTVELTLKIGAQGKSFGSVTSRDIESSLKSLGYEVDRRQIRVVDVIKGAGLHKVEVKLHSEVIVPVQVKVIAAAVVAPAFSEDGGAEKKSRRKGKKAAAEAEAATEGSSEANTSATETE